MAAALPLALAGLLLGGCASAAVPASARITAQRAQYVDLMLSNSYAAGPETERGIMSVISGYGGGYVTSATLSGAGANELLTLNVVLGGGEVRNLMQGETDLGVSDIACFTYTLAYGAPRAHAQVACPASLTTASARSTAARQIDDQVASEQYDRSVERIPATLAAAQATLFPTAVAVRDAHLRLTAADFAAGTDGVLNLPMSALALPQPGGACDYVVYRWVRSSYVGGGTAGSTQSARALAWVAPTAAACTGAAALAAGEFLTLDRYAGG